MMKSFFRNFDKYALKVDIIKEKRQKLAIDVAYQFGEFCGVQLSLTDFYIVAASVNSRHRALHLVFIYKGFTAVYNMIFAIVLFI